MYKISIGVLCLVLAIMFSNAMTVSGESDDETISVPLGVIHLAPPEDAEDKQPPVPFPHGTHFVYTCNTCHHQWEMDGPIESCTTSGCHDGVESPIKAGGGKVDEDELITYYKTAYHRMCIGCHKEIKAQNKRLEMSGRVLKERLPNPGPSSCKGCHVAEE
ncbi:MAG: cytochrome c3 family protein [Desulfobacterales bacterium]|jgi:hypothetical protein